MTLDSSDDSLGEIIQRIQAHVLTRRIRLQEFFRDSDRLRCGRCTEAFFARGLTNAGLKLTEAEVDQLIEHYTDHSARAMPPATVNYSRLCVDVDEVFHDDDKQEMLRTTQMSPSPSSTVMSTFIPNSVVDEEQLISVLHRVATLCRVRGITVKATYNEVDRSMNPSLSMQNPRRSGKVSKDVFIKKWPFRKEMTPEEIDLICERFTTKTGDFHYMALHNEVAENMPDAEQPFPTSPLFLRPDDTVWSHTEVHAVDRIKAKVAEKRVRVKEFFQDFDPLRKGFCSPSQAKTVLTLTNLAKEIDKAAFEQLLHTYMRDDGYFSYKEFCRDVDSAFTTPGLEKLPLITTEMPDEQTTSPARRSTMRLSPKQESKISRIEDRLRTFIVQRRAEMKPMFQDFDRTHRGYVSRTQFARIMISMGFDLDEKAIGLLCASYCDNGNHNDFNWKRFLRAVDPPAADVEAAMLEMTSPFVPFKPRPYFDSRGKVLKKVMSAPML